MNLPPTAFRRLSATAFVALMLARATAATEPGWPHWRGPSFNGSAPDQSVPEKFSPSENVLWSFELKGESASTPIITKDSIFLSAADNDRKHLLALCLDANSGKERWNHDIAPGIRRDNRSTFAAPSPVTDGERVWFFFSTGDLVAYDLAGKELWRRNIQKDYGEFAFQWTFSSSPTIYGGRLYLQVLQRDVPANGRGRKDGPNESYLLALDPVTGRELWRHVRPSEARQESLEAFTTPIPLPDATRPEILIAGGDCITGHDPESGAELWRWGTWNPERITHWRLVPSPVSGAGVVLACAPKGGPIYAVPTGLSGNLKDSALRWTSEDRAVSSDVATPLFHRGRFYILNGSRKTLSSVDPASGKVIWTGELDSSAIFESSPTGVNDQVLCINHRGEVFVVGTGDEFRVIAKVQMGTEEDRQVRSSIAVANHRLYIRTDTRLYCIGER